MADPLDLWETGPLPIVAEIDHVVGSIRAALRWLHERCDQFGEQMLEIPIDCGAWPERRGAVAAQAEALLVTLAGLRLVAVELHAPAEAPISGTALEEWPILTRAMVMELRHLQIRTVEELATLSDIGVQRVGMGGLTLRERAKAFLDAQAAAELRERAAATPAPGGG